MAPVDRTATHPRVIQRKVTIPSLPDRLVARPHLTRLITRLIDRDRVVLVTATAGAGKTTALVEVAQHCERPVAWLTLDETDRALGRLVTYLEASLARIRPDVAGTVTDALAARIPHAEAAGLLAEAIGDEPVLLVVDEVERIDGEPEALAVLETFIRYAHAGTRTVLASRHEIAIDTGPAVMAAVRETDLAFTPEEAAQALADLGRADIDPVAAVEATGGWVTGVLFEAWSARDHVIGSGGEHDPLHGYLSTQILARLSPEDRDFLVETALLDAVTPSRAAALGRHDARVRLGALRRLHLPVTWDDSGEAMRCHPRFREFLREQLDRGDVDRVARLRTAHGRLLASEGLNEEAVGELLRAGAVDEARASAEIAIEGVIERLDFPVAERWLDALRGEGAVGPGPLAAAELILAVGREQYRRGERIADQLATAGEREATAHAFPRAAAAMAWCYFHVGRLEDAHDALDASVDGPAVEAARYLLRLASPGGGDLPVPMLSGEPMDALVLRVHAIRGHLTRFGTAPRSRWADAVMTPWRISALRAAGQTERALELFEGMKPNRPSSVSLHALVAVEILIDLGRRDDALEALRRGRDMIARSGSLAFAMQSVVVEAKLELRLNRDPAAAMRLLDELARDTPLDRYRYVRESADVWYGLALLQRGEDEAARERLTGAVDSMLAADRILELPRAGVYLAEAAWRCGDEEAADRAADVALDAAQAQQSRHTLLQALADYPAVLSRRLDAEAEHDSPWHDIGRAMALTQGPDAAAARPGEPAGLSIELREFGEPAALADGEEVRPRLSKAFELLAYLAHRDGSASRSELLDALFASRADRSARTYLRQAIHALRQALPESAGPEVADGTVRLPDGVTAIGESARYEGMLAEAARLDGTARLEALLRALAIPDRGEYLAGFASAWIDERRAQLDELTTDARFDAAQLAFDQGRHQLAAELAERVLSADAFREGAWRLTMRIANALGDDDRMISAFRRCEATLAEIGATPARSTRRLLEQLRA